MCFKRNLLQGGQTEGIPRLACLDPSNQLQGPWQESRRGVHHLWEGWPHQGGGGGEGGTPHPGLTLAAHNLFYSLSVLSFHQTCREDCWSGRACWGPFPPLARLLLIPLPYHLLPPHNHSNNLLRLRGASTSAGCAASCKASPRIAPFGMTWSQCSGTTVSTSETCQSFDLQGLAEETWRDCPAVPPLPFVTFKVGLLATQRTIYLPTQWLW